MAVDVSNDSLLDLSQETISCFNDSLVHEGGMLLSVTPKPRKSTSTNTTRRTTTTATFRPLNAIFLVSEQSPAASQDYAPSICVGERPENISFVKFDLLADEEDDGLMDQYALTTASADRGTRHQHCRSWSFAAPSLTTSTQLSIGVR